MSLKGKYQQAYFTEEVSGLRGHCVEGVEWVHLSHSETRVALN